MSGWVSRGWVVRGRTLSGGERLNSVYRISIMYNPPTYTFIIYSDCVVGWFITDIGLLQIYRRSKPVNMTNVKFLLLCSFFVVVSYQHHHISISLSHAITLDRDSNTLNNVDRDERHVCSTTAFPILIRTMQSAYSPSRPPLAPYQDADLRVAL